MTRGRWRLPPHVHVGLGQEFGGRIGCRSHPSAFTQMTRAARTRSNLKFWVVLMLLAECMSVCCDDEWCLRDVSYPHVESPDYTLQFQPQQSITTRVNRRGSFLTFSSFQHKLHESVLLARPGMYKTWSSAGTKLCARVFLQDGLFGAAK